MQNLSLELAKALFGACLLVGHSFASAKAISFSESQTTTHCLFIEQLELADLEVSVFKWFDTDGLISLRRDWFIGFKV